MSQIKQWAKELAEQAGWMMCDEVEREYWVPVALQDHKGKGYAEGEGDD